MLLGLRGLSNNISILISFRISLQHSIYMPITSYNNFYPTCLSRSFLFNILNSSSPVSEMPSIPLTVDFNSQFTFPFTRGKHSVPGSCSDLEHPLHLLPYFNRKHPVLHAGYTDPTTWTLLLALPPSILTHTYF